MASPTPRTLYDKIWDAHVVERLGGRTCVIYVDRHLLDEVQSPQAFEGLRRAGRAVRRPASTLAVADHNVPTQRRREGVTDPKSRTQIETLEVNVASFGVPYIPLLDERQGIVHVIGPELGFSLPGQTIVRVIRMPRRTARWALSRSASVHPRSSRCWRRRRWCRKRRAT